MARTIKPMSRIAPTMVEVPEDVATDLAESLAYLEENPSEVLLAGWDDASGAEKALFVKQAQTWALTNGLKFKQVTSKNLGPTGLRFWVGTQEAYDALRPEPKAEATTEPAKRGRPRKAAPAAAFASAE